MTPTGSELEATSASGDNDLRNPHFASAAKSGAASPRTGPHGAEDDPDLAAVVAAWPRLSSQAQRAILAIISDDLTS